MTKRIHTSEKKGKRRGILLTLNYFYAFVYMSLPFIPVCELVEGRSTVFIFVTFIVSRTFQELTNDR